VHRTGEVDDRRRAAPTMETVMHNHPDLLRILARDRQEQLRAEVRRNRLVSVRRVRVRRR
jgi:hypothetical protein